MAIENLHEFITEYFIANKCEPIENENGKVTFQLTDEMDELIMNRPFYWHYIKKIGQAGQPMKLSLITNPERREEQGEWIHFGSPRLHQIFRTLSVQGKITKQFENNNENPKSALIPWLVINARLSFKGKHKKDEMISLGLQMINGAIRNNFMQELQQLSLTPVIPDFCYTITPMIRLKSGYQRLINYAEEYLRTKDYTWAKEAWDHLYEEGKLLEHFYKKEEDNEEANSQLQQELKAIEERFRPNVSIEVVNGGIFYLSQQTSGLLIQK
ncbi:YqhG family protein [Sediminibacillus massiliensis]|uniref:YqhG family protein n=1 Tax=Sediminibacillus massiliensis TaxID=1926277 RepID=UPI0009885075|nr:YqhG family protein [Sediminibacillus massiliensis]